MRNGFIAVFESTTETLKAERALKEAGFQPRPIIKPRILGGSCQMALKFTSEISVKVQSAISEQQLRLVGYFFQDNSGQWVPLPHK